MTPIQRLLLVFVVLFALCLSANVHECTGDCYINCTVIGAPGNKGCADFDILDASRATSATIDCTSASPYEGGCQLLTILCPSDGDCTINCNDYYGCYGTNITAGSATQTDSSLTLNCNHPDSSCTDTIINAPYIDTLNIHCIGVDDDPLSSLSSTTCHNMMINANYIQTAINIDCASDYSCSYNTLYANNSASVVTIGAIGLFAFYENIIYAPQSSNFSLFCGSEAYTIYHNDQFGGCTASTLYIPPYSTSSNTPRTSIECEGEGCHNMDIYSIHGALDIDIKLNGCSECDQSSCIHEWNMHCGNDYETEAIFSGDLCIGNEDDCDCKYAVQRLNTAFINNDMMCDIFEIDYICESDTDCIIDCSSGPGGQFTDGCKDKIIHGASATSLSVICDKSEEGETCSNARISCPTTDDNTCDIVCKGSNACFELEIHATEHTKHLNISCIEKDACSYIEVTAVDAQQVSMDCVVSDACDNFNIYANATDIVRLKCEAQDIDTTNHIYSSAYAACNHFNVYASDNTGMIDIQCNGDFSCYYGNIYGERARNLTVDAEGQYALYYGNIYAANADNVELFCRSEFGEQSCYRSSVYAPQYDDLNIDNKKRLDINCEGHGCYYLNLYAVNGWSDVNIEMDGCSECDSVHDCVQNWYMHCGYIDDWSHGYRDDILYINTAIFDGLECDTSKCDCAAMKQDVLKTFTNSAYSECGFFSPDITCDVDTECVIDCEQYKDGCNGKIISGSHANSLVINCNNDNGCSDTQIYCPTDANSRCDVKCVDENSCYLTQIYGDEYNLINIDCLATHSCVNTSISAPNANAINVLCVESQSCQHVYMEATYARMVDVLCSSNNTYDDACDNINIIATHSRNEVNIECDGDNVCKNVYIFAEYGNIINVNGIGSQALYSGAIHGEYAHKVNVLLYADTASYSLYYSLYEASTFTLYLPEKHDGNISSITCQGYGCNVLNIASRNGLTDYAFNLNGCGLCAEKYLCYYDWNIFCGNDFEDRMTVWQATSCYDDSCGCKESMNVLQQSWDDDNSGTCGHLEYYDYECVYDENGWCVIDCQGAYASESCRNKIINATNEKTSVVINCGGYYGDGMDVDWSYNYNDVYGLCQRTKIYCPKKDDTGCGINCLEDDSCTYAKIYSDTPSNRLWLNCSDYGSCLYTKVIAPHLDTIDIMCDGSDSCYGLDVEATYVDTVNAVCKSSKQTYDDYNYYWQYGDYDDYNYWDYPGYTDTGAYYGGGRRRTQDSDSDWGDFEWNDDYFTYDYPIDYDPTWYFQSNFACDQIVIDANHSKHLNVLCDGNSSCYYSLFYASHGETVNLTAVGIDSFQYDTLYAHNAHDLYVKCNVAYNMNEMVMNQGACSNGYFHIPSAESDETTFICEGYGCLSMTVYSRSGLQYVTIEVDGCHVCGSADECIDGWDIYCDYNNDHYDEFNGDECSKGQCPCSSNIRYQNTVCNGSALVWDYQDSWDHFDSYHAQFYRIILFAVMVSMIMGVLYCVCAHRSKKRRLNEMNNARDGGGGAAMPMDMNYRMNDNNIIALEPVEGQFTVVHNPMGSVSTVNPAFVAVDPQSHKAKGDDGNAALIN